MKSHGVGASVLRKEDDRHLRGRGKFVGDIQLPGTRHVAFLRSPAAHGHLRSVSIPAEYRKQVFVADDLLGVSPIRARSSLPGFKPSDQPVLAHDKVRHVGELIAMCVANTRAEAEDIVDTIGVEIEELPVLSDMLAAREADATLVHDDWGDNVFLTTDFDQDLDPIIARAAASVTRTIRTARQSMSPLEGRAVLANWDSRLEQLVVYTSTQQPHIVRTGLSECLGIEHAQIRVVAPDVGGGFGYKGILLPEEICLGWAAKKLGYPLKWLEDRRENLTASSNCREHHYTITAYGDTKGRLIAIDAEATVDAGAYSSYPFSACLEAAQVVSILPGLYDLEGYRCRTYAVATNKPPILPYRGVARSGVCTALELMVDALARELAMEPVEVRFKSLVGPEQMPFNNITNKHFDSGNYPESLRQAIAAVDLASIRKRQQRGEPDGRQIGIGFAMYSEQGAHGTTVYAGWGIPMVPGHEQCSARLTPDGGLELRIGAHSHGQGLETTLAQVAHEVLGIGLDQIRLIHGDTALTPYSTGTWGSRSMVMSGGAVACACDELARRVLRIGANLLQCPEEGVSLIDGAIHSADGSITLAEVARTWYLKPQDLDSGVNPAGLEVTAGYKPQKDSGTFSYATHAAVIAVDPLTGEHELLDYVIAEDGGILVNPMIVEGQTLGGLAQGIGTALFEEMAYSADGQPQASTLSDYLLPGASEVPDPRIIHLETPSPYTRFGVKGIGEGGCIAPPGAIINAINDALHNIGAELSVLPVTPRRIVEAVSKASSALPGESTT
jgi:carbon-monoxide dehydrogenase large subunit